MDDQNYDQEKSNRYGCLPLSKVGNIQNPCLSLKSGFFRLVYWFVNLNLHMFHLDKLVSSLILLLHFDAMRDFLRINGLLT